MGRGPLQRFRCAAVTATSSLLCLQCGGSPTSPDRHGIPQVTITCVVQSGVTQCRAPVGCSLYPCAANIPADVTDVATWRVDNPAVARLLGPGLVQSVAPGHTLLRVSWAPYSEYWRPIAVFPGTSPLPTYEYAGFVFDGAGPPRAPLNGALVEVLNGPPAGRTMLSGTQPEAMPGASATASPGHYAFFGMPEGPYRLRVSKNGYATQEIETRQFADVTLVPLGPQ